MDGDSWRAAERGRPRSPVRPLHDRQDAPAPRIVRLQASFAGPIFGVGLGGPPPVFVAYADGTCRVSAGVRAWMQTAYLPPPAPRSVTTDCSIPSYACTASPR